MRAVMPTFAPEYENLHYPSLAEGEMNLGYKFVLDEYRANPKALVAIRRAQRTWMAFRDAQVQSIYPDDDRRKIQSEYGGDSTPTTGRSTARPRGFPLILAGQTNHSHQNGANCPCQARFRSIQANSDCFH